jgi:hypothetical protein
MDRVAAGAPVGQLLFVEARGCHSPRIGRITAVGIELATIDAHRAAEAAADIECGVAREARRDRLEIGDFPGRDAGPFRSSSLRQARGAKVSNLYGTERSCRHVYGLGELG